MKNILIISIFIMLVSASCNKIFKKDLSLTPKEYQMMGMPDQNKLSSNNDYVKVVSTLYRLRRNNPLSYPRKHSKKSGTVFACLINKENLLFVNDSTRSLTDRAMQIQALSSLQNSELQIYTDNFKSGRYYNEEVVDIYIFGILIRKKMFELAGKINNSKSDSDIAMQSGTRMVIDAYLTMISTIFDEQIKSDIYTNRDLKRLSTEVSSSLIENQQNLDSADKQKIIVEIQNVVDKSSSPYIKGNYLKVLKALSN